MEGMFYLVPEAQMNRIMAQLDRIEANTQANKPPVLGAVLSADAVARTLGVKKQTVYAWAREGKLKSVRAGRRVLFTEESLRDLLKGGDDGSNHNSTVSDDSLRGPVDGR